MEVWIDNDTADDDHPDVDHLRRSPLPHAAAPAPGCGRSPRSPSAASRSTCRPGPPATTRGAPAPCTVSTARTRHDDGGRGLDRRRRPVHDLALPRAARSTRSPTCRGTTRCPSKRQGRRPGTLTLVVRPSGEPGSDADHRHGLRHPGPRAGRHRRLATRRHDRAAPTSHADRPADQARPLRRPRLHGVRRGDGVPDRRCTSTGSPARSPCG